MPRDPIVEEVHQAREKLFLECNGDLAELMDYLKKLELQFAVAVDPQQTRHDKSLVNVDPTAALVKNVHLWPPLRQVIPTSVERRPLEEESPTRASPKEEQHSVVPEDAPIRLLSGLVAPSTNRSVSADVGSDTITFPCSVVLGPSMAGS
jgi:hypothetical protein